MPLMVFGNNVDHTPCPNLCNNNGNCSNGSCQCITGYTGADCSLRTCPVGSSWSDDMTVTTLTNDDNAHHPAECSNRGICDRNLGVCVCEHGRFGGVACEHKLCVNNCSSKGRCVSSHELAGISDPGTIYKTSGCTSAMICNNGDCTDRDYSACTTTFDYSTPWESEMMHGCLCDEGFEGYDCSKRTCARGDDPLTLSQLNDVQLLQCTATSGTFTLSFLGFTTTPISATASLHEFSEALGSLPSIKRSGTDATIDVQFLVYSTSACGESGNDIQITFNQNFGDLSLIIPNGSNLDHSTISVDPIITSQKSVTGSKESDTCSNRGTCTATGVCYCLSDWTTSNGYGSPGLRGDCGHDSVGSTSNCPGDPICHGHGTCSGSPAYRCECDNEHTGPDCSLMTCSTGKSWFNFPSASNEAHSITQCSDMGICNEDSGLCECADGFAGAACQFFACPGPSGHPCNDHGDCLSVSSLAQRNRVNGDLVPINYGLNPNNPLTWDHDQVLGCFCSDGWGGYDCSLRTCAYGDDPQTFHQANEISQFVCEDSDSSGSFVLTFRDHSTITINGNQKAEDMENALNDLPSINHVSVTSQIDGTALCQNPAQVFEIEFLSPTGDVPLMLLSNTLNIDGNIQLSEHVKGTKEYATCSNRGLCDKDTGECRCFSGFASSDGQGNSGSLADCGFKNPYSRMT